MEAPQLQLKLLQLQLELEESNLKYAVELQKDYIILKRMRDHIAELREQLNSLQANDDIPATASSV